MAKNWCSNGTMVDTTNYSFPVPFIGLYTAIATLVCLLLIICDMWAGFRSRKPWLPCRYFSLNSVTLTLLSIASKLPVDLTSPMPSAQDQLSKLIGTVFICTSMAFLMPSLGIVGEFESYANLLALSIFVVTVVVNISIQIATGVIFSFVVEHIIVLFSMLVLLVTLWVFAYLVNGHKEVCVDRNRDLMTKDSEWSFSKRLKVCYIHGYCSCPQLGSHRVPHFGTVSLISTICSFVLAETVLRSIVFKDQQFCRGTSDYGWSMWILVGTQTFTIVLSNFAIGYRWITFAGDMKWTKPRRKSRPHQHPHLSYLTTTYSYYTRNFPKWLNSTFGYVYRFTILPINMLVTKFVDSVTRFLGWCMLFMRCKWNHDEKSAREYKLLLKKHKVKVREWILRRGVEDMEKWMELNRSKPLHHLRDLLSTTSPSQGILIKELRNRLYQNAGGEVSSLSILLLVEMAKVSITNSHTLSLMEDILGEVFDIIHFIDNKINVGSFNSKIKAMSAEVLWKGKANYDFINTRKVKKSEDGVVQFSSELDQALGLIRDFHRSFVVEVVREEACAIASFVQHRSVTSLEELSYQIKLLFADMLHVLLSQLPKAIFNHIVESPVQEYEERVRLGLKFICQMESLDSYVDWSFPSGCNPLGLLTDQIADVEIVNTFAVEGFVAHGIEEVDENQSSLKDDSV